MVFGAQVVSLTCSVSVPCWEFPKHRFVEYGPEDEWWARQCGFGKAVTRVKESLHFPRAVITKVDANGTVRFTALPDMFNLTELVMGAD